MHYNMFYGTMRYILQNSYVMLNICDILLKD